MSESDHKAATLRRRREAGQRLIEMREACGLSQADLCRKTRISSAQMSQYETGARDIPRERAIDIVLALSGSLDFLYLGDTSRLPTAMRVEILRRRRASA